MVKDKKLAAADKAWFNPSDDNMVACKHVIDTNKRKILDRVNTDEPKLTK